MRLAINFIADRDGLTNETMAPLIGAKLATLANYRAMNTSPKADFIEKFCQRFDFDKNWLSRGQGEPFLGASKNYPTIFGPEHEALAVAAKATVSVEDVPITSPAGGDGQYSMEFSIAEDLTLAAKVLESKTHYATALHLNIRSFAGAVNDAVVLNSMKGILSQLQERFTELESKVAVLQDENKTLRSEVNRLKATYESPDEGSGPLAHSSAG